MATCIKWRRLGGRENEEEVHITYHDNFSPFYYIRYKNKYINAIYRFCFQIGKCAAAKKAGMAPPLGLPNVTGVFVVTIGGCALAT